MPVPSPRRSGAAYSAMSAAPTGHSAPKKNPSRVRHNSSCSKFCEVAVRPVNRAYAPITSTRTWTLPKRSASLPPTTPPTAELMSAQEVANPPCAVVRPNVAMIPPRASGNIWLVKPSRPQPLQVAQVTRRTRDLSMLGQRKQPMWWSCLHSDRSMPGSVSAMGGRSVGRPESVQVAGGLPGDAPVAQVLAHPFGTT